VAAEAEAVGPEALAVEAVLAVAVAAVALGAEPVVPCTCLLQGQLSCVMLMCRCRQMLEFYVAKLWRPSCTCVL
jgi:hypothetical protein